jgi:hypothetical protein
MLGFAGIKALQHLLIAQGMIPHEAGRLRPRLIRQDQMALLAEAEPELAEMVRTAGAYLPDLFSDRSQRGSASTNGPIQSPTSK